MDTPNVPGRRRYGYTAAVEYTAAVFGANPNYARLPRPVYKMARAGYFRIRDIPLPDETWGMLVERTIHLTTRMGYVKARFTVGHEMGHGLLGTGCEGESVDEAEANAFASGLLMPHDAVRAFLEARLIAAEALSIPAWVEEERRFRTLFEMRKTFGVSLQTALQTLTDMGAVKGFTPWESVHRADPAYRSAALRTRRRTPPEESQPSP